MDEVQIEDRRDRAREINWDSHLDDPDFYDELVPGIAVSISLIGDGFVIFVDEKGFDTVEENPDPVAEDRWNHVKCVVLIRDGVLDPYEEDRENFDSCLDETIQTLALLAGLVDLSADFEDWNDLSRWPLLTDVGKFDDFETELTRVFENFEVLHRWPGPKTARDEVAGTMSQPAPRSISLFGSLLRRRLR